MRSNTNPLTRRLQDITGSGYLFMSVRGILLVRVLLGSDERNYQESNRISFCLVRSFNAQNHDVRLFQNIFFSIMLMYP